MFPEGLLEELSLPCFVMDLKVLVYEDSVGGVVSDHNHRPSIPHLLKSGT
jgi:hypothetical protein